MGNMFDNYTNLNPTYVPNNKNMKLPDNINLVTSSLKEQRNVKGEFVAWEWNYGDTCQIQFPINHTIKVESNALIYTQTGDAPTTETVGSLGQKAYNTVDMKCWVCNTLDQSVYNWIEKSPFEYPLDGGREITIITETNFENINIKLTVYNSTFQTMYEGDVTGQDSITLNIEGDLAVKLIKGVYYCYVLAETPSRTYTLNRVLFNVR